MAVAASPLPFTLNQTPLGSTGQSSLVDQLQGAPIGPANPLAVNVSYLAPPVWSPGPQVLPGSPVAFIQSALGTGAAITYNVVAVNGVSQDSVPSAALSVGNNAATPNNTICWLPVPGAVAYRVLKNGKVLATVGAGATSPNFPTVPVFTYTDSAGATGNTYTPATSNPLAYLPVAAVGVEGQKATYRVSTYSQAMITVVGPFLSIGGVAGRIINVRRLTLQITATAATTALSHILLFKRTTGYTGGATQAVTPIAVDSNDAATSAAVTVYTGGTAPTAGTGTQIGGDMYAVPATGGTTIPTKLVYDFGTRNTKAVMLRGAAEFLEANIQVTAAGAGAVTTFDAELTDESA